MQVSLLATDPPHNVKVEPRSNNAIAAGLYSFTAQGRKGTAIKAMEVAGMHHAGYAMELDPLYADIVVGRWEAFTGGKAERIPAAAAA